MAGKERNSRIMQSLAGLVICLPKRIPNMPTQESVDHVWRILLDPPALSGLACWREEDRYGILHDIVWVYSF